MRFSIRTVSYPAPLFCMIFLCMIRHVKFFSHTTFQNYYCSRTNSKIFVHAYTLVGGTYDLCTRYVLVPDFTTIVGRV